jgi:hypothetical protein
VSETAAIVDKSWFYETLDDFRYFLKQLAARYHAWSNRNTFMTGPTGWVAEFERILILEDPFRSGYECSDCDETGMVVCPDCVDGHSVVNPVIKCKTCQGERLVKCAPCGGKGVLLEIPEVAQRRPTTGRIVSIGHETKRFKRGDSVLYSNFVGEVYDLTGIDDVGREKKVILRVMKEREVICSLTGHMELKRVTRHQFQGTG